MTSFPFGAARTLVARLVVASFAAGVAAPTSAESAGTSETPASDVCDAVRQPDWLSAINRTRTIVAACGVRDEPTSATAPTLAWSPRLERAAREHAAWLAAGGGLEHVDAAGRTVVQRALAAGYRYARLSENLAWGPRDIAEVIAAWAASPEHCANLVDAAVSEMALACQPGAGGHPVWVLVLGRPR